MKKDIKDVFYELSLSEIEKILNCVEAPSVANKDSLENIKKMTKKKCGLLQKRKIPIKRVFALAACVLLAVAVALGVKYINFGNNPPIVSGEASDDKSAEGENSFVSEESTASTSTESENTSTEDNFEIKGINWRSQYDQHGNVIQYDGVKEVLDKKNSIDRAWASVTLNNLTPIGSFEREWYVLNGTYEKAPNLNLSLAEITINKIYHEGDIKGKIKEGDTIKIIVTWIVEDDKVQMTYSTFADEKEMNTLNFPMTEIGENYVIGLNEIKNDQMNEIIKENAPEHVGLLASNFTYPIFAKDFTTIKNLSEFNYVLACPQIYVAIYDRYMKGNVSEDSEETRFYNCFKDKVYSVFGPTPEKPREKS